MGKVVSFTNLTLGGVTQAPGRPDEDRRGDFPHGGWATPLAAMQEVGGGIAGGGALLLGRRTYEDFYSVWPNRRLGRAAHAARAYESAIARTGNAAERAFLERSRETLRRGSP